MNEIWVLSVKTSWLEKHLNKKPAYTRFFAYDSFEKARAGLQKIMKNLAFSKNPMFDGKGNITAMKRYMDQLKTYTWGNEEEGWLNGKVGEQTVKLFHDIFCGMDVLTEPEPGIYEGSLVEIDVQDDEISCYGAPEGPINGYAPMIATNMFSLQEEKDYYLYLNDLFGQDVSSELYIDLQQTKIL